MNKTAFKVCGFLLAMCVIATVSADNEFATVLNKMLAHDVTAVDRFNVHELVSPGEMYDPLVVHVRGDP